MSKDMKFDKVYSVRGRFEEIMDNGGREIL